MTFCCLRPPAAQKICDDGKLAAPAGIRTPRASCTDENTMTHIRYDIIPQGGGWSIAMGGAVGPPYAQLNEAVRDTEHVASVLMASGDVVDIVVWQGGEPHL